MNILLIFATNSGGTQIASGIVSEILKDHNHQITVKNVREADPSELANFDLVIFGSPTWDYNGQEGQVHVDYRPFMEKAKGLTLPNKKFAVYGLGDSTYTYFCGAVGHLENFIKNLGGQLITDSLKIDGFYFDQDKNSKIVSDWAENLAAKLTG